MCLEFWTVSPGDSGINGQWATLVERYRTGGCSLLQLSLSPALRNMKHMACDRRLPATESWAAIWGKVFRSVHSVILTVTGLTHDSYVCGGGRDSGYYLLIVGHDP